MDSPRHSRSQEAVEAFNKNIISKLRILKQEDELNFNIIFALDKAVEIYSNTIHSTIKIEPIKAFKIKTKKNKLYY